MTVTLIRPLPPPPPPPPLPLPPPLLHGRPRDINTSTNPSVLTETGTHRQPVCITFYHYTLIVSYHHTLTPSHPHLTHTHSHTSSSPSLKKSSRKRSKQDLRKSVDSLSEDLPKKVRTPPPSLTPSPLHPHHCSLSTRRSTSTITSASGGQRAGALRQRTSEKESCEPGPWRASTEPRRNPAEESSTSACHMHCT